MNCYVISILFYGSECSVVSSEMKKSLDSENTIYGTCEQEPVDRIRKGKLKSLVHTMRKEELEKLTLIEHIRGKRNRGKQQITCQTRLCKLMTEQRVIGIVKR